MTPEQTSISFAAPPSNGSPTSVAAAASMVPHTARLRRQVYDANAAAGAEGRTCDELEAQLGLRHQTCSGRCTELRIAGKIVGAGVRKTRSGRHAVIWTVAP
jgi:hypothetical protein